MIQRPQPTFFTRMFSELQAKNSWLASDHTPERTPLIDLVRYSLYFPNQPVDLDIRPDPESMTILVIDPERPEDANPVANLVIEKRGNKLVVGVYDWQQINADEANEQTIVLYDLEDTQALPAPEVKPGVHLTIDGGVVHGLVSNVPGLEVRAFDHDILGEDEERDPPGEIIYHVDEVKDTELDWERYRREEMGQ